MVLDDMYDSRSRDLRHLDALNSSGQWMISTTLDHDLNALNTMNNSGLLIK